MIIAINNEDLNGKINNKTLKVYIIPFTPVSIFLRNLLEQSGVEVLGFCDNDPSLNKTKFSGKMIYSPLAAYENNPDAAFIMSEIKYYEANKEQLLEIGFNDIYGITDLTFEGNFTRHSDALSQYSDVLNKTNNESKLTVTTYNYYSTITSLSHWDLLIDELKDRHQEIYTFKEKEGLKQESTIKFLICINAVNVENDYLSECLKSLQSQNYNNYSTFIIENDIINNIDMIKYAEDNFADYKNYDFIVTLGANDTLSKNALNVLAKHIHEHNNYDVFTANEDRIYNNEYISPYYKNKYQEYNLIDTLEFLRNIICVKTTFSGDINNVCLNDIYVINEVLYHYRILENANYDNKIKPIAFYLPQFHRIPENDEWWGEGFTEWTNVKRAVPMFDGHEQPRIPGELGYYDLVNDKDIQKRQMDLARAHGIYGFCYYHYWFNGKRLLEKPLDNVINNIELDMPFCICWANENWSRRWDGRENEVLMPQNHNEENDIKFIVDVLPYLKDPRYIKINNAPYLLIYRCGLFPNFRGTVDTWRKIAKENGIPEIHISIVNSDGYISSDFSSLGCDSVAEFPTWRMCSPALKEKPSGLNPNFAGYIYDYNDYVYRNMNKEQVNHLRFRGLMLGFDNTARRMENAIIYHGSTPENYKKLMMSLVDFTARHPNENERFIFINAWNEWAEGNHLEPDERFGHGYLKATSEALKINC
jgi:hypothetical protein